MHFNKADDDVGFYELFILWLAGCCLPTKVSCPSSLLPRSHKPGTASGSDAKLEKSANIYFFKFRKHFNKFSSVKWLNKPTLEHTTRVSDVHKKLTSTKKYHV